MRLRIHRSDGRTGQYSQPDDRRAAVLARRFDPTRLFLSGPIVVGVHNPFTVLNADEVCWVEVSTDVPLRKGDMPGIEQLRRLADRAEYEALLARQWPLWRKHKTGNPGDLLEALIELSFRGGDMQYLHAVGVATRTPLPTLIFGRRAITAAFSAPGLVYFNPKAIVRARVYHSRAEVEYPDGIWCAEADDL